MPTKPENVPSRQKDEPERRVPDPGLCARLEELAAEIDPRRAAESRPNLTALGQRTGTGDMPRKYRRLGNDPSRRNLIKIADTMGVSLAWLADGRGPRRRWPWLEAVLGQIDEMLREVERARPPYSNALLMEEVLRLLAEALHSEPPWFKELLEGDETAPRVLTPEQRREALRLIAGGRDGAIR